MLLSYLKLKNIGPFKEQTISFVKDDGAEYPVVIFTGENGTGKSIVIDAVRTALRGLYGIERDIISVKTDFYIELGILDNQTEKAVSVYKLAHNGNPTGNDSYREWFNSAMTKDWCANWMVDYWSPDLSADTFNSNSITSIQIEKALIGSLNKTTPNVDLSKFISSIDYIRGSEKKEEAAIADFIYKKIKSIFDDCVGKDAFQYVERESITPMIKTHGKIVSMEKLSSGNILLIKHLIGLMSRMYGICRMNDMKIENMPQISGILLIDEIENHLHPKWQKSIVGIIRKHFPNLQIILTTHSPFVVSSVSDAKIFVCVDKTDHCELTDATADYSNEPVDDVLGTSVFDVDPFSKKISEKLEERKKAIRAGDKEAKEKVEKELIALNEDYFGYYNLEGQISYYDKNETH